MSWNAKRIVYTGPIDALYDYDEGVLEYRSLRWEHERHDKLDYQGVATVNYTDAETRHTRIIEWKHFMERPPRNTVISREYPEMWREGMERYYPIGDGNNRALARIYQQRALQEGYILGGRLASYRYMNMDQVIGQAMRQVERLI